MRTKNTLTAVTAAMVLLMSGINLAYAMEDKLLDHSIWLNAGLHDTGPPTAVLDRLQTANIRTYNTKHATEQHADRSQPRSGDDPLLAMINDQEHYGRPNYTDRHMTLDRMKDTAAAGFPMVMPPDKRMELLIGANRKQTGLDPPGTAAGDDPAPTTLHRPAYASHWASGVGRAMRTASHARSNNILARAEGVATRASRAEHTWNQAFSTRR